ncbi:unnamed protein product, partial [Mesorhabditis belari]|uniref:Uncharacterized protein n=1 Tax=Mesorhabditis belari TaxID=2138241 RepID=A0AAF3EH28_9BILA
MSSTADNYYLGSLPLAAMAWIRLGVQPMVCLVGDPKEYESNLTRPSIEILKKLNTTITFLQGKITLKKATIAQHCRLYAANSQLPLQPEDVIIISDSDYIPIHKERHWADGVDLMLYNSQCCGYENHRGSHFPHLTVLTMGMTVATFREVLGTSKARYENATSIEGDLLNSFGKEGFEEAYNQARDLEQLHKHRMWYSDQILISYRINQWKRNKPGVSRTGEWSLVGARLDRMSWPRPEEVEKINVSTYGDMHLMRPAMKKWLDIRPVFKNLFSPEFYKMADDYGVKLLDYHSQDLGPNPQSFV